MKSTKGNKRTKELWVIAAFVMILLIDIICFGEPLPALVAGVFLFGTYSCSEGNSWRETLGFFLQGMKKVSNILMLFMLIGSITALWRACGTIPGILCMSLRFVRPEIFVLCSFLLCCVFSFLTGTSFGTAGTVGIICMMIARAAGMSPIMTAGAILSGSFFGDRCSVMSSSAQLVATLTGTDIYDNVKNMFRTGWIPFFLSCLIYLILGSRGVSEVDLSVLEIFEKHFELPFWVLLPALIILAAAVCRIPVKTAMAVSLLAAAAECILLQHMTIAAIGNVVIWGFHPEDGELASILSGGGLISMVKVSAIVLIASSFSGIFDHTPLIRGIQDTVGALAAKISVYPAALIVSIFSGMISCNQSMATILMQQICDGIYPDKKRLALDMENTVILTAALIPWSIAGAVPLATIGGPMGSYFAAVFLYLVPLVNLAGNIVPGVQFREKKKRSTMVKED